MIKIKCLLKLVSDDRDPGDEVAFFLFGLMFFLSRQFEKKVSVLFFASRHCNLTAHSYITALPSARPVPDIISAQSLKADAERYFTFLGARRRVVAKTQ